MANFKLNIADPKTGKCFQKEVKDDEAAVFTGKKIKDSVTGDSFGMPGYEFSITGGSDYCGFPMRSGILGVRKKIVLLGGVGFKGKDRRKRTRKGMKRRKTICGHKINDKITQINLKVEKAGSKKLAELFGGKAEETSKEEKPGQAPKEEAKPKEDKKEAPKQEKKEAPKKEEPKAEEKTPEEKKE